MIDRRAFLVGGVSLLGAPLAGEAQQVRRLHRIGYLSTQSPSAESARLDAFRHALRALGYVDGQNIGIEYRFAEGNLDRISSLAAELVAQRRRHGDRG